MTRALALASAAFGLILLAPKRAQAVSLPPLQAPPRAPQQPTPEPVLVPAPLPSLPKPTHTVPLPGPPGDRRLTAFEKKTLAPYIPAIDLERAVLHIGRMPIGSQWVIDADGITPNDTDIYFEDPKLTFLTADQMALLAHELVHIGQYRNGMTWLDYLAGGLYTSEEGHSQNKYEAAAIAMEDRVARDLNLNPNWNR